MVVPTGTGKLTCAITGKKFSVDARPIGWYAVDSKIPHNQVVSPQAIRAGWMPVDGWGRGPEYGMCGIQFDGGDR